MKKIHPVWFALSAAILFITLIVVINFYTLTSAGLTRSRNELEDLQNQVQTLINQAEANAKDLRKFQAKKYGVEEINPADIRQP